MAKSRATTDLERFLRCELGRRGDDQVTRLEVRHCHTSGSDRIWSGNVEPFEPVEFDKAIELLVTDLGEKMQADADSKSGRQTYLIIAAAGREIVSQRQFSIRGQDLDNSYADGRTESPDVRGQALFAMRHIDGAYRLAVANAETTIKDLRDQVTELREENRKLQSEVDVAFQKKLEWMGMIEAQKDRTNEREIERDKAQRKDARRDKILGTAGKVLPRLLAHVPGGEEIAKAAAAQEGFEAIITDIAKDPEKLEQMRAGVDLMPISDKQKAWLLKTMNDSAEQLQLEAAERTKAKTKEKSTIHVVG